jgi:PAS domain S-box-containing protein
VRKRQVIFGERMRSLIGGMSAVIIRIPMQSAQYKSDIQDRVARTVVQMLLPAVFVLCLSTGLGVLYFMPDQWFRAAPPFIAACPLVFVHILVRRGYVQTGAAIFLTVISIALIAGMYLNGGVNAPAYSASLAVLAVIAWLYGFWAALVYTVAIVGMGALFVALASFGMLDQTAYFGPFLHWVLLASFHVGLLVATSVPHRILRDALASSEERRIEAENAYAREMAALRDVAEGQAALRASEARYRDIFEKNRAVKLIIDPGSGRIVQANSAACAFYGYTKEEMTRRAIWDINILGEAETRERMNAAIIDQQGRFNFVHRLASGELRDVMVYTGLVEAGGQRLLHSIILDVTDQVRAERELRLERQRLAGALEGTRAATWEWNLQTGEMSFDERWAQIAGYTLAELQPIGVETWLALVHPADFPEQANRLQRHVSGLDAYYDYECRMRHKDGHWVWVHDRGSVLEWTPDGEPLRMYGTHADITVRKQAEAERYRLLWAIEQSGESIYITDSQGTIQFVNSAFEHNTGFSRNEALGQNPRIMKSGHHDSAFYAGIWQELLAGKTWQGEIINRHKSGTLYTALATIAPVMGEQGETVSFVAAMRDITGQRELEHQYRHAQKMEAIGQLTGGVAHDFNNLLQVINGYTEIAQLRLDASNPVHDVLKEVAKAGTRASELVGQLLAFSRRQIMQPTALDVNEVVAGLLKMLGRLIGEHIRLHFDPRPRAGYIFADRGMLEQVIVNLCVNARDAMPEGGHLLLETDEVTLDGAFCTENSWALPGRFAHLRVADNGCGMAPQALDRIFEPFYTTKGVGKGTGLGLATVYGIVKQHEGLLHVESTPGQGSVFHIYLPASDEAELQLTSEVGERAGGGTEHILVAEDDEAVCQLAREILEGAGYTVWSAQNGAQACELFATKHDQIALAILDVVMPEMGGREARERMHMLRPNLPVLFTTGYSQTEIHTNFVLDKGLTLLKKPYNQDALLRAVREALEDNGSARA